MGEEDGERRPFAYFVDHTDPDLLVAVREGRAAEMGEEGSLDPGAPETFAISCLEPATTEPERLALRRWYTELLAIRASTPIVTDPVAHTESHGADRALSVVRRSHAGGVWFAANFGATPATVEVPSGAWSRLVDAADPAFGGEGTQSPRAISGPGSVTLGGESFVCYLEEDRSA
jgi:maltooligosyltrehalose trehalohydrolase